MKLKKFLACAITCGAAFNAAAEDSGATTLSFYNVKTHESIVIHHERGQVVSAQTNHFMRDWRKNEDANMDLRLFDLLIDLQAEIKAHHPNLKVTFEIICGYRNPATNEMLRDESRERNRKSGEGDEPSQAKKSQHLRSGAIDYRVRGLPTLELRDRVTCRKAGGVGYYPGKQGDFVHMDVGDVRYWPSREYLKTLKCN